MKTDHRWNTREYEERTRELYRVDLCKLYPSEAWSLYRVIPACKTVVDLGCGNGAMAEIIRKISPETCYTGMDHQENLMNEAKTLFPYAEFSADSLENFIDKCHEYDCVMSWSVLKSFKDWRRIVSNMLKKAKKYVVFDLRISNIDKEIWDADYCWADYGGRKGPILALNYKAYKEFLLSLSEELEQIEICGYESSFGKFVHFKDIEPKQFIVTAVLKKKSQDSKEKGRLYEQLPQSLRR